jgi:hypothetical protein
MFRVGAAFLTRIKAHECWHRQGFQVGQMWSAYLFLGGDVANDDVIVVLIPQLMRYPTLIYSEATFSVVKVHWDARFRRALHDESILTCYRSWSSSRQLVRLDFRFRRGSAVADELVVLVCSTIGRLMACHLVLRHA